MLVGLNFSIFQYNNQRWFFIYNNNYSSMLKTHTKNTISFLKNGFIFNEDTKQLLVFINQMSIHLFTKIKFTGKGYKIKKNNNKTLGLLFNRAHKTNIWWKNIFLKKLKKYKIYIKYSLKNKNIVKLLTSIRLINIFTKKGLRTSKQIIFKKKGKK